MKPKLVQGGWLGGLSGRKLEGERGFDDRPPFSRAKRRGRLTKRRCATGAPDGSAEWVPKVSKFTLLPIKPNIFEGKVHKNVKKGING